MQENVVNARILSSLTTLVETETAQSAKDRSVLNGYKTD